MADGERRLIEDVLPIGVISEVAASEKVGGRIGHPSSLHLWWARRPLAAARAAVYAALVPTREGSSPVDEARFFKSLCRWGGPQQSIDRARAEVLAANGGVPPKVLDMFAGGGAIPLEAARLGCDATAVELNPVAHLIEKAMLEYPQRFPGLADDIRKWGKIWVDRAWERLADLYPPVSTPTGAQGDLLSTAEPRRPIAYLWTRTVRCPNPAMAEHQAPLVRQTWLARKPGRHAALKPSVDRPTLSVRWEVVEAPSAAGIGFDPAGWSKGGQTTCRVCGSTIENNYVKSEGKARRLGTAPLAAALPKTSTQARTYLAAGSYPVPDDDQCDRHLAALPVAPLREPLPATTRITGGTCMLYGFSTYEDLFTPRQRAALSTLAALVRETHDEMVSHGLHPTRASAVVSYLAMTLDRVADHCSSLCPWVSAATFEGAAHTYTRQALPMLMDFAETNPFGGASGDVAKYLKETADLVERLPSGTATTIRASATSLPVANESQDAVIVDPPYYDNISYADLSDFFYVWLKRSVGFLYPEDFGGVLAPKRHEAVVAPYRHDGSREAATSFYESMMAQAFQEAHRVLKPGTPLVCIYAHKTTLGWSSLIESLRGAGFTITEAWPLDTEMPARSVGQDRAALASSIFLVARKRASDAGTGLEGKVLGELDAIIAERLDRLAKWEISGSDLVIAAVGAGLRAFTKYERVERANGEELPAEGFLVLVQNRVLDTIFGGLRGADPITRFYVAAQFSYGYGAVPFDEVKNLAYTTGVELDGPKGVAAGANPLVVKEKGKLSLCDFEERGHDPELGKPDDLAGVPAPVVDVAHGVLWRAEYRTRELKDYLMATKPDLALLRTVIQTLAGKALRSGIADGKAREQSAAERLLVSWRRLVEDAMPTGYED